MALRAIVPPDAFTAQILGTLRIGHGAVIGQDLVVTIGYLITEAEQVWLQTGEGKVVAGHPLGVDMASGLGLVRALEPLSAPALEIGDSHEVLLGDRVIIGGGGRRPPLGRRAAGRAARSSRATGNMCSTRPCSPPRPIPCGAAPP